MNEKEIESELLKDPKSVYFASVIVTVLRYKSIPCKVAITSGSIMKVKTTT